MWPGSSFCDQDQRFVARISCLWSGSAVYGQDHLFVVRISDLWSGSAVCGQDQMFVFMDEIFSFLDKKALREIT